MLELFISDFVLVYLEGDKPPPPRHAEFRQTFLENLAKSQIEFEEVSMSIRIVFPSKKFRCKSGEMISTPTMLEISQDQVLGDKRRKGCRSSLLFSLT